jgi:hypothetical protein
MVGRIVSHYRILKRLPDFVGTGGEGRRGVVYEAHDTMLDRAVALKSLTQYLTKSTTDKARFLGGCQVDAR